MECPFSLELPEDEEDQDPEYDADEHLMKKQEKDNIKPVEDFKVEKINLPESTFD